MGGGLNTDIDTSPRVEREVVLASEPVGGRSRVTELPCLALCCQWRIFMGGGG